MSKTSFFRFKQFTVHQGKCAMKVGTDGTLLGSWAQGGRQVLDIGTGTGLIALMMAQRFPQALLLGIDIDADAIGQATENVAASPFAQRIDTMQADVRQLNSEPHFDAIVCNPPYYDNSLTSPNHQRTLARHTATLSYNELMAAAWRLLSDDGEFSVIIPAECKNQLDSEALLTGFFMVRQCAVRTTPNKGVRRYMLAYKKHPAQEVEITEGVVEQEPGVRSPWYAALTKDFYL